MSDANERTALRRLMREQRRNLDEREREKAAALLRNHLLALPRFRNARNLGAYLAVQGEISLAPAIEAAWSIEKPIYIPCLQGEHLEFHRYTPHSKLIDNRFGIPEPDADEASLLDARLLDLVLTPLVAFDKRGGRLGTGGGYYDRTFQFLRRAHGPRPFLLGVAYEFQRVPTVPMEAWDIPLDAVMTDAGLHEFQNEQER